MSNATIAGYTTYKFADNADVAVNSRLAADAVGATKMDRPEWCAVHPVTGEIYYTLTNNSNRKVEPSGSAQQRWMPPTRAPTPTRPRRPPRRATSTATSSA
jgi:secreted PhoX family phosphatase